MRFRTKPFEIEAIQFDGTNAEEINLWSGGQFFEVEEQFRDDDPDVIAEVMDDLHSTWVGVKKDQWIIKGAKGEFYPCDPEIFEAKYEVIDNG